MEPGMGSWANQHGSDMGGADGGSVVRHTDRHHLAPAQQRELLRLCLQNYRASHGAAPIGWRVMFQVLIKETERLL